MSLGSIFFLCRSSKLKKIKNTNENKEVLNISLHDSFLLKKNIKKENDCENCEIFTSFSNFLFSKMFYCKENDVEGQLVINEKEEKEEKEMKQEKEVKEISKLFEKLK